MVLQVWFASQEAVLEKQLGSDQLGRIRDMLRVMSGKESPLYAPLQAPYTFFMPSLRASPFHDAKAFKFTGVLERAHADIVTELQALLKRADSGDHFEAYEGDGLPEERGGMTAGEPETWTVFYFFHNFQPIEEHLRLAPKTAAVLQSLRDDLLFGMVCFSVLKPGM